MRREAFLSLVLSLGSSLRDRRASRHRPPGHTRNNRGWDIDVRPDGQGLPPGHGNVRDGAALYAARCAGCHGARGEGAAAEALAGGQGSLASAKPLRTVGSYWPYATTLFDYVRRAMPFDAPQSLSADETYAVSAYVLHLNGLLPEEAISTPPRWRGSRCRTATASPPIRGRTSRRPPLVPPSARRNPMSLTRAISPARSPPASSSAATGPPAPGGRSASATSAPRRCSPS